jgi:hypothetical protein
LKLRRSRVLADYSRYQFGEEKEVEEAVDMSVVEVLRLSHILSALGRLSVESLRKVRDIASTLSIKRSEWERLTKEAVEK